MVMFSVVCQLGLPSVHGRSNHARLVEEERPNREQPLVSKLGVRQWVNNLPLEKLLITETTSSIATATCCGEAEVQVIILHPYLL